MLKKKVIFDFLRSRRRTVFAIPYSRSFQTQTRNENVNWVTNPVQRRVVINPVQQGGGGVFGIRYQYFKNQGDKEATFKTNKISSFVPTTIKNLFDLLD